MIVQLLTSVLPALEDSSSILLENANKSILCVELSMQRTDSVSVAMPDTIWTMLEENVSGPQVFRHKLELITVINTIGQETFVSNAPRDVTSTQRENAKSSQINIVKHQALTSKHVLNATRVTHSIQPKENALSEISIAQHGQMENAPLVQKATILARTRNAFKQIHFVLFSTR
jgi:hypothetical protein